MPVMAAVLALCRGGPETDCNSTNLSTPKALFKLVMKEAASLPQVEGLRCILHGWVWDLPCVAVSVYPICLAAEP